VRNLPAVFAGGAFNPPVAPARAVPNLQDGPEESRIARVTVLALTRVAEGGRVIGVEPNTTVGLLVVVLGPALADRPPMSVLKLARFDPNGGIGERSSRGRRNGEQRSLGAEPFAGRRTSPRRALKQSIRRRFPRGSPRTQ
jgi:hypothetical protein